MKVLELGQTELEMYIQVYHAYWLGLKDAEDSFAPDFE